MTGGRDRTAHRLSTGARFALLLVLAILFGAQAPVLVDLSMNGLVYENVGITDFGRDLLGASVVELGENPYQQIGDLLSEYDPADLPLSGPPRLSGWVVHPPLALAGARVLLVVAESDAEVVARRVGILFALVLAVVVVSNLWRKETAWAIPVGIAVLVWAPTFTDTVWIQWNAIAGLGLLSVAFFDAGGRRMTARVTLGVLVAWKPWLAVFALAFPRSTSVLKDVFWVGTIAVATTLAALPWAGGFEALWAWLTEALPGNSVEARNTPSNLSWTSMAGPGLATAVYVGAALLTPMIRQRVPRDLWLLLPVGLATALAPFVWDHYWLALAPVVWLVAGEAPSDLRIPAFGWMGLSVMPVVLTRFGLPGMENRVPVMVFAGAWLLLGTVISCRRSAHAVTGNGDEDQVTPPV